MAQIDRSEIRLHQGSYIRRRNFLFHWRGDLYRAFDAAEAEVYRPALEAGLFARLSGRGWVVPTERTDHHLPGYPLVVRHLEYPVVTYPYEWSPEMLRAAALRVLDVLEEMLQAGYLLRDQHAMNVIFDGPRPVWVDAASLTPLSQAGDLPTLDPRFERTFLAPLQLHALGFERIARARQHDLFGGLEDYEVEALVRSRRPVRWVTWAADAAWRRAAPSPVRRLVASLRFRRRVHAAATARRTPTSRLRTVAAMRRRLGEFRLPEQSGVTGYYLDKGASTDPTAGWDAKQRAVAGLLEATQPASVLDLGCNEGWFSSLAAAGGARVVAADSDAVVIDRLFLRARDRGEAIHPLVLDLRQPDAEVGMVAASVWQRLPCDFVLALALQHHLVLRHGFTFELLADILARVCRQRLCLEFIPRDDVHLAGWAQPGAWYEQAALEAALRPHFRIVEVLPSTPSPRVLLHCERRQGT